MSKRSNALADRLEQGARALSGRRCGTEITYNWLTKIQEVVTDDTLNYPSLKDRNMKRTIILLMALVVALGSATLTRALMVSPATEKVIRMKAKNFEFIPGEITVKKGEPVVLELTSEDRAHGINLSDFGVRAEVKPGKINRVSFNPDKTGRFSFTCDVFCGSGHADMTGTLVVTE